MVFRGLVKVAVLAAVLIGAAAVPAQSETGPEPWQPYRAEGFISPAGRTCDFDLRSTPVEDEEEYRVTSRYPNGNVREYEFRGTLVTRNTNLRTGESVDVDLSGHAWQGMYEDGETTKSFTGIGPFSFGFREQDSYPRGYYRFDGFTVITLDRDGTRHLRVHAGEVQNICEMIS